jgi:uncharacterized protein with PIN domain
MILDSSPLVAILAEEPDAELYIQAISRAPRCRISGGNFIELAIGDRGFKAEKAIDLVDYAKCL